MTPFFSESDYDSEKDHEPRISLRKANRLIQERAKVVTGIGASWSLDKHYNDTHQALLICVEEIEKDSAESLLREMIEHCEKFQRLEFLTWVDRAKRLLGGEK